MLYALPPCVCVRGWMRPPTICRQSAPGPRPTILRPNTNVPRALCVCEPARVLQGMAVEVPAAWSAAPRRFAPPDAAAAAALAGAGLQARASSPSAGRTCATRLGGSVLAQMWLGAGADVDTRHARKRHLEVILEERLGSRLERTHLCERACAHACACARELVCGGMCVRVRARLEQRAHAPHPTWSSRRARRRPAPVGRSIGSIHRGGANAAPCKARHWPHREAEAWAEVGGRATLRERVCAGASGWGAAG